MTHKEQNHSPKNISPGLDLSGKTGPATKRTRTAETDVNKNKKFPEWKVYYDGSFYGKCCGRSSRDHAGTELPVNISFLWDNDEWLIPSVYSCSKGLVIDFLRKVPAENIRRFMDKWQLGPDSHYENFNSEQQLLIELDNPLVFHPLTKIQINGSMITRSHSTGICWNPVFCQTDTLEAQMALRHYGLDPACGWAIWRSYFPWTSRRKPQLRSLSVHMAAEKQAVPGPHFHVKKPGAQIVFTYPADSSRHTLTVKEFRAEHMDTLHFHDPEKQYPDCFIIMGYTIDPPLPKGCFSIADHSEGDKPRLLQASPPPLPKGCFSIADHSEGDKPRLLQAGPPPLPKGCFSIAEHSESSKPSSLLQASPPPLPKGCFSITEHSEGSKPSLLQANTPPSSSTEADSVIIGGAYGPTSLILSDPRQPEMLYATSAPHFEPVSEVEWRMIFHEKRKSDIHILLIGTDV